MGFVASDSAILMRENVDEFHPHLSNRPIIRTIYAKDNDFHKMSTVVGESISPTIN